MEAAMSSPRPPTSAFQRLTEFAKRVIAVPKAEVDAQEKKWQKRRAAKRRRRAKSA
jgi:hypothetical protein